MREVNFLGISRPTLLPTRWFCAAHWPVSCCPWVHHMMLVTQQVQWVGVDTVGIGANAESLQTPGLFHGFQLSHGSRKLRNEVQRQEI